MERQKTDFKAVRESGGDQWSWGFELGPLLFNEEEADSTHYSQGAGGQGDDSMNVNGTDLSLHIPSNVEETGVSVASLEKFSTHASDKDENKVSEASGGRAENGERSDLDRDYGGGRQENGQNKQQQKPRSGSVPLM